MNARECNAGQALAQDALKVAWIVRLQEFGRPRQMKIIQARHPEPVRARAQHVAPVAVFFGRGKPPPLVPARHPLRTRPVEAARWGGLATTALPGRRVRTTPFATLAIVIV